MIDDRIKRKIVTVEQLVAAIGARPRVRKVIMCHGTFDIVHPGHVRHLAYAKSKADVLIASLTADRHVTKANARPFVPHELRAYNLAALEAVDWVIVDEDAKPLRNLGIVQPDFFAKGFEYVKGGIDPRTQEELDVLEGYGGEFLYTPGDVVFSSSAIIEAGPPDLAAEKLGVLLEAEGLDFARLRAAVGDLGKASVHVIGDMIVDGYTYTTLIGGNTKTPTFSVRRDRQVDYVGGAGIVAKHLAATGARVTLTTVLGDDPMGRFVRADLEAAGVKINGIVDPTRPTTHKNAFIAGGYRLLKVDSVDNRSIGGKVLRAVREAIAGENADAVVFSDFRHGIFNRATIPELTAAIPAGSYRVADSQVASRWGNILEFEGFDLITPNEREARFSLGDQDSVVRPLGLELFKRAKARTMILKLGERGVIGYRVSGSGDGAEPRAFFVVDSLADRVLDAVGAGDALLAYATLAMVATHDPVIATVLGSIAAGVECGIDGNTPVAPGAVLDRLAALERRAHLV
ncbi:MAG: PfkB family carbohydrate kinase [Tagaea sp.]|nr:PfkB family carbohydrate kinase [Tagaea sp.]